MNFHGFIVGALFSLVALDAAARPYRIDDLDRIENVTNAQLSPDGQWVLYSVDSVDVAIDGRRSGIWLTRWEGGEPVRLTRATESASTPRWSPDGRWISFLRAGDGAARGSQLWLLDRTSSGEARRATDIPGGIGDYIWSPDSRRIAVSYREELPPRKDASGKEIAGPWLVDRARFKEDGGVGYLHDRIKPTRIYLYDLEQKSFEPLTSGGEFEETSPAWSPDGSRIAFVSNRDVDWQYSEYGDIYVALARANSVPQRLTDFPGADTSPAWSPDSREIAFLQGSEPQYRWYNQLNVAVVPATGGAVRRLTDALDRDISRPQFSSDGRAIHFLVDDNRRTYAAQVAAKGGDVRPLLASDEYSVWDVSEAKGRMVVRALSSRSCAELYALDRGKLRALTRHNEAALREVDVIERQGIDFLSADGERVYGLLAKPAGYRQGQRYPTILWLHGGPYGQDSFAFTPSSNEVQLFAANGYAVVQVNFRGSRGRGKAFGRGIFADWGNRDVADALAAVDHVVQMGVADPQRLGVGGWSYGGMLTNFITVSDARFKVAISGAASGARISQYGTDLYPNANELEWGPPWGDTQLWLRMSRPLLHANRISTPTLFVHGVADYNVPVNGSEQMYRALKTLRVPTQLVLYPGEHHGITRPSYAKDLMQRYLDWYGRYLQPEAATVSQRAAR